MNTHPDTVAAAALGIHHERNEAAITPSWSATQSDSERSLDLGNHCSPA